MFIEIAISISYTVAIYVNSIFIFSAGKFLYILYHQIQPKDCSCQTFFLYIFLLHHLCKVSEPKLQTDPQTSDPFGFCVQSCWHTLLHRHTHHAFTDISMQRHARVHITGRWRGTEITPWSIILWKLKGPPAGSRRLCTEQKGVGVCGCLSALPENLPLMDTEVQLFLCTGYSWLAPTFMSLDSFLPIPSSPVFLNRMTSITS